MQSECNVVAEARSICCRLVFFFMCRCRNVWIVKCGFFSVEICSKTWNQLPTEWTSSMRKFKFITMPIWWWTICCNHIEWHVIAFESIDDCVCVRVLTLRHVVEPMLKLKLKRRIHIENYVERPNCVVVWRANESSLNPFWRISKLTMAWIAFTIFKFKLLFVLRSVQLTFRSFFINHSTQTSMAVWESYNESERKRCKIAI